MHAKRIDDTVTLFAQLPEPTPPQLGERGGRHSQILHRQVNSGKEIVRGHFLNRHVQFFSVELRDLDVHDFQPQEMHLAHKRSCLELNEVQRTQQDFREPSYKMHGVLLLHLA